MRQLLWAGIAGASLVLALIIFLWGCQITLPPVYAHSVRATILEATEGIDSRGEIVYQMTFEFRDLDGVLVHHRTEVPRSTWVRLHNRMYACVLVYGSDVTEVPCYD